MDAKIHINGGEQFQKALTEWLRIEKRDLGVLMREVAANFVRRAIAITPPSTGTADVAAKKRGETAIKNDIQRFIKGADATYLAMLRRKWGGSEMNPNPVGKEVGDEYEVILEHAEELQDYHRSRRSRITGRTPFEKRKQGLAVTEIAKLKKFIKEEQKDVGFLAAGFNRAAMALGVSVPAWIARHSSAGEILLDLDGSNLRIVITNAVRYGERVRDLERRIEAALKMQGEALERRTKFLVEEAAKKAGVTAS